MQIPISRRGGGGVGLNFEIVGGTTTPMNPKENTIWVNTSVAVTGWFFGTMNDLYEYYSTQGFTNGMIIILTGSSSNANFNACKENTMFIHPYDAAQIIDGLPVTKEVLIYQNGSWKDLHLYLYNNGDQCVDNTNGWKTNLNTNGICTFNTDHILLNYSGSEGRSATVYTASKIDISNINTLYMEVNVTYAGSGTHFGLSSSAPSNLPTSNGDYVQYVSSSGTGLQTLRIDVQSYTSGSYYIWANIWASTAKIYKIWGE